MIYDFQFFMTDVLQLYMTKWTKQIVDNLSANTKYVLCIIFMSYYDSVV